MKRIMILIVLIGAVIFACGATSSKPILVISSCFPEAGTNGGSIFPEIAVNPDGSWRQAVARDLWVGQEFSIMKDYWDQDANGKVKVNAIGQELPASFRADLKFKESADYYAVYSNGKRFVNKGVGKVIKPESVNATAQSEYLKQGPDVQQRLQNVVKADWANIKKDFPRQLSAKVDAFLAGDFNGDNLTDYALILGEGFGGGGPGTAAVVIYLREAGSVKRIPVGAWSLNGDTWPLLVLARDFNGDKAEELIIGEADSDTTTPIVYGWSQGGLMKLYHSKVEFWAKEDGFRWTA